MDPKGSEHLSQLLSRGRRAILEAALEQLRRECGGPTLPTRLSDSQLKALLEHLLGRISAPGREPAIPLLSETLIPTPSWAQLRVALVLERKVRELAQASDELDDDLGSVLDRTFSNLHRRLFEAAVDASVVGRVAELEARHARQQKRLGDSHSLLSSVLESPDKIIIFSLDRDYCYTAFNANHQATMKQIWGADIEIGANMLDLIRDPEDRAKAKTNFDRVLAGERFTKIEQYGEPPHRFFYEDIYNPILDDRDRVIGLTLFLTDITSRVQAEEELMRYQNHLEELVLGRTTELQQAYRKLEEETQERRRTEAILQKIQRLEALGTLAGGVAHDFNNLLTAIVGYSSLLAEDLSRDDDREHLERIQEACDQGAQLTSRLLAFSRRQILQPASVDLGSVVEEVLMLLGRLLPENIEVVTSLARNLPLVAADRGQLEQVIMNLVLNARDAMPEGGWLRLRTRRAGDGDSPRDGREAICLEIEDSGHGIEPENLERIFDPFFTTKEDGQGSGLGLSVVYGIVQQHKGEIRVFSRPDDGAMFQVTLPISSDDRA